MIEKLPPETSRALKKAQARAGAGRAFKEIEKLKGDALTGQICEAVILSSEVLRYPFRDLTEEETKNPFLRLFYALGCTCCTCSPYEGMAQAFISNTQAWDEQRRQAQATGLPTLLLAPEDVDTPLSLQWFINRNVDAPHMTEIPGWLFEGEPEIERIVWFYFHENRGSFDRGIERACEAVYQGVPLYKRVYDGFVRISFAHEDFVYLAGKHRFRETSGGAAERPYRYPWWSEVYYFKWSDLQARESLFGRWGASHGDAAPEVLRRTLWKQIGADERSTETSASTAAGENTERRLEASEAKNTALLRNMMYEHHWEFVQLVCEGALGITRDGEKNPFAKKGRRPCLWLACQGNSGSDT